MSAAFELLGPNRVRSTEGFTVWTLGEAGVMYQDSQTTLRLGSQWTAVGDVHIILYTRQLSDLTFEGLGAERKAESLDRGLSALEFMGHPATVEKE